MKVSELEAKLALEAERWSARGYAELSQLRFPVAYDNGLPGSSPEYYETRVNLLRRTADAAHLVVAVTDGETRAHHTLSDDLVVPARTSGDAGEAGR